MCLRYSFNATTNLTTVSPDLDTFAMNITSERQFAIKTSNHSYAESIVPAEFKYAAERAYERGYLGIHQ